MSVGNNEAKNKRLMSNTILLYVRMIVVLLITFYTTRIILQTLGVEDYGIYNVVSGFVAIFGVLNKCLTTATNRFYNFSLGKEDFDEENRVYNASVRIQLIFVVFLFIVLELFGTWYLNNKMVIPVERLSTANFIFHCSVISLLFLLLQTPYSAAVMAHEKMNYYAVVSVIDAVLKLGIAITIKFVTYDKLYIYGLLMLFIAIINFLLYYFYSYTHFKELRLRRKVDSKLFRSLLSFSCWSILDPISYIVRDQGSNMTLNLFFGPIINAAYGIAAQISSAVANFSSSLSVAFRPQIIQSYSGGDYDRTKGLMIMMSKTNYVLQYIIALPLLFELPFILNLWLGNSYPEYTVIFSIFIVLIHTFNALNEPISIVMVSTGRIKLIKTVSAIIICSVVPLGYIALKCGMEPYSVYIIMSVLTVLNQVACVIIMTRTFRAMTIRQYLSDIAKPCFVFSTASLLVPLAIYYFMDASWIRFVLMVLLSVASSVFIAVKFCFNMEERKMFFEPFLRVFKFGRNK